MIEAAAVRQAGAEVAHWRLAVEALADLDAVAAPDAWASLEEYLQHSIRERLAGVVVLLTPGGPRTSACQQAVGTRT